MKKLMILAVAMMASLSVNAQVEEDTWYVTPKAGFSVADLTGKLYDPSKVDGSYDATLRPLFGFTADSHISRVCSASGWVSTATSSPANSSALP